ncbi:MAG: D-alanine--D-alanine ligase [Calditrichaeota bacterium]|nr:MAG: D-alanine--D-alanine ligase [Calditrichota bacterium]
MRIAVLLGGDSPEREVSLSSGQNIVEALRANGHAVTALDPGEESRRVLPVIYETLHQGAFDMVFNALHGGKGENGYIQSVLEMLHVPFTGSGAEGCMLAMDKEVSKLIASAAGIATPKFALARADNFDDLAQKLTLPFIIKPADGGSSLGFHIIRKKEDYTPAWRDAIQYGMKILAEQYVPGSEIAAGVLKGAALPLVHIIPKHEVYDYTCKYTPGMSRYVVPADLDETITRAIQETAVNIYGLLGLKNYARIDFLVGTDGIPYFIEANTLPGMTATSLLPKAARAAGWDFNQLLEEIIQDARRHYEHQKK